ncbi:hypothetical protein KBI23_15070 [bacterium]|nr:hypothetical protein [bacterium]
MKKMKKPLKIQLVSLSLIALTSTVLAVTSTNLAEAASKGPYPDSTLPIDGQKQLQRAVSAMKSKNWTRARDAVDAASSSATDAKGCLFIIHTLDAFGGQGNKVKRAAVEKALGLAKTSDELMEVAKYARQCEMYDLSKKTLDELVSGSNSYDDLMTVAHHAHEAAMADLAHLALHKAYSLVNNEPDALDFIRQASNLGIDDLARKAAKDLIEDQTTSAECTALTSKLEQLKMPDQIRAALKRALEKATTVADYLAIFNAAKHFEEADIVKVAQYRGRKLTLMNKIKGEKESTPEALADQSKKSKEDLIRRSLQKPSGF